MSLPGLFLRVAVLTFTVGGAAYGAACARSGDASANATPAGKGAATAPADRDSVSSRADRGRIQGDSAAPVWMVIVSDFQCPYCRLWHDSTYPALVREYVQTGKVRMAYVNFPLPSHRNAWPSAEVAMCSGVQGKFWQMQDKVFATQERWSGLTDPAPFFDSLATAAGVDAARMRACVASRATRALIQADHDRASRAGINSTPNFIIGNQRVEGAQPIEYFRRVLDSALAAK